MQAKVALIGNAVRLLPVDTSEMRKPLRKPPPRQASKPHWIDRRLDELNARGRRKSKKKLADFLKLQPSRITDIIQGRRQIKSSEIKLLSEYLELPDTIILDLAAGRSDIASIAQVYVVGEIQAGRWKEALKWEESHWQISNMARDERYTGLKQFGLRVVGPSMNELYPDGSVVVCVDLLELGRSAHSGERVVVQRRRRDGFIEATIKELRQDAAGEYWLWPRSTDPAYQQPWKFPAVPEGDENEDVRIVALVIGGYRPE